ncbi:MAG: sensor histidine kinase [Elusimicrobia bacterium]|nr:sensor histidine kinase [Elusimicrobiota bacterium]
MSIRAKLSLLLVACIALPLGLAAGLTVVNARWALRQARLAGLEAVAELKVTRIRDFFQERHADIAELARSTALTDLLKFAASRGVQTSDRDYLAQRARLGRRLSAFRLHQDYSDIMSATADGMVVFCGDSKYEACAVGRTLPLGRKDLEASRKGVWLGDIDWKPSGHGASPHMLLAAPVRDEGGRLLGVVAASLSMGRVFALIQDNTGLGQTGETVVGRGTADGIVLLAPTRYDPGALFKTFTRRDARGSRLFPIQRAVSHEPGSGPAMDYRGEKVLAAWRYIPELDWGVVSKIDADEAYAPVRRLMTLTLLLTALLLGLGALAAFFVSGSVVRPLRELQRGAQAIGQGEHDCAIEPASGDELGQLAQAFNRMARDVKESQSKLREAAKLRTDLISLINHEYANGLTNMRLAMGLLRATESGVPDETRRNAYQVMLLTLEKLKGYTANFLNLHRLESGQFEAAFQPIAVRSVLLDDLVTLRPLAEAKRQSLTLQAGLPEDMPVAVRADPDCLSLIINNLVTNAVKYTPEGGRIVIRVSLEKGPLPRVSFSIEDNGIGISAEDRQRILPGFYRTKEGQRAAKGFGVGLLLVRKLLEQHGSRLEIASEPGQGSRFSFSLPVWTQEPVSPAS